MSTHRSPLATPSVSSCHLGIHDKICFPLHFYTAYGRKAPVYAAFLRLVSKKRWHLGGIYRLVFRDYRKKNGMLPPLYRTPSKPTFVRPVHNFCPSTLSVQLSFHPQKCPISGTKKGGV